MKHYSTRLFAFLPIMIAACGGGGDNSPTATMPPATAVVAPTPMPVVSAPAPVPAAVDTTTPVQTPTPVASPISAAPIEFVKGLVTGSDRINKLPLAQTVIDRMATATGSLSDVDKLSDSQKYPITSNHAFSGFASYRVTAPELTLFGITPESSGTGTKIVVGVFK